MAQLGGLTITSAQQLLEPGLPRKELLVRTLEQVQDQRSTIFRFELELAKAQKAIRSTRTLQNALQTIRLLPDEVLSHIMALSSPRSPTYTSNALDVRHPLVLSHVCQHWRTVALATPHIWTHVPLAHLSIAPHFLRRSQSAPLDLKIQAREPQGQTKLRTILPPPANALRAGAER